MNKYGKKETREIIENRFKIHFDTATEHKALSQLKQDRINVNGINMSIDEYSIKLGVSNEMVESLLDNAIAVDSNYKN